ncbi:DUF2293 domain-containing protein [Planctomycetes bacterium K23_9]|uniref:DUF2293 domain-containing protein n=1 Tax=Stieleria marina TaxID=1930275 RepID=A0A517P0C7_9BACT|nr:hypothetical protein K239x_48450 [Planctomycetes bacterium K23_9]
MEEHIQCGPAKLDNTFRYFRQWTRESNLESAVVPYQAASRSGNRGLRIMIDVDREVFFQTRYQIADQTPARKKQIQKKLTKAPDLVVYVMTAEVACCSECDEPIHSRQHMYREADQPLCTACADSDYLEFLPSGNATLTRRAKKHSRLSAVVVCLNRRRKRYDRQGLLVTAAAIEQAENSMQDDAGQRACAAVACDKQDKKLVAAMVVEIGNQFPSCPAEAPAARIAQHTAEHGSGRVGRSAAGRDVDPKAIKLAVIAHIRYEHTGYDNMLMQGVARDEARRQIQLAVAENLAQWQSGA